MREKTISTKYFKTYKIVMFSILSLTLVTYVVLSFAQKGYFGVVIGVTYFLTGIFVWFPALSKTAKSLKQIAYDKENLVVFEDQQQTLIPLEHIKDIELTSLDGLYKFTLSQPQSFGNELFCKTSMWYPFNYPKVDKELDYIRYLVRQAKQRAWQVQDTHHLTSNTPQNS
jgi:hypothetical protein